MAVDIKYVRWTAEGLPDGLTLNEDTGVISGTPNAPIGTYSVYVTVETNYGSDSKYIMIVIETPREWMPVITPDQTLTLMAGSEMEAYEVLGTNVRKTV